MNAIDRSDHRKRMEYLGDKICEARFAKDKSGFRQYLVPNVVYRLIGHQDFSPFNGTFVGPDAVMTGILRLSTDFRFDSMKRNHLIIDGDHLVYLWSGRWRNRGTNAAAEFEGVAHVQIENFLIKRYTNFIDTALIADISGWES